MEQTGTSGTRVRLGSDDGGPQLRAPAQLLRNPKDTFPPLTTPVFHGPGERENENRKRTIWHREHRISWYRKTGGVSAKGRSRSNRKPQGASSHTRGLGRGLPTTRGAAAKSLQTTPDAARPLQGSLTGEGRGWCGGVCRQHSNCARRGQNLLRYKTGRGVERKV